MGRKTKKSDTEKNDVVNNREKNDVVNNREKKTMKRK